jgi:SAM-dependent MidA family methyltransferase
MTPLAEILAARIAAEGPLPFESFMECALYDPGHGYYTAGSPFGPAGDFYTGPSVSGALGRALGRHLADQLAGLGVSPADLVELGAGDGRLAATVAPVLAAAVGLRSLHLIDRNPGRLPRALGEPLPPVLRISSLDQLPTDLDGAVYANELLDALPVARYERLRDGSLRKSWVDFRSGRFVETWRSDSGEAAREYGRRYLAAAKTGYVFEHPFQVPPLLARIGARLRRGLVVFIDYGDRAGRLLTAERSGGTLRAFRRHRVSGAILDQPGAQDLTADVNFDFVMDCARDAGLELAAYRTQGQFLAENGLLEEFRTGTDPASVNHNQALKHLLLPGGMGEVFKVLVLRKGAGPARSSSCRSRRG